MAKFVTNGLALVLALCAAGLPAAAQRRDPFRPFDDEPRERRDPREFRDRGERDTREFGDQAEPEEQDLQGAYKLCTAAIPGNWRDTIPVPDSWTVEDCQAYSAAIGGQFVQLGCVFPSGDPKFSLGTGNGTIPDPDCGWGQDDQQPPRRTRR